MQLRNGWRVEQQKRHTEVRIGCCVYKTLCTTVPNDIITNFGVGAWQLNNSKRKRKIQGMHAM
jgi:hypothetical protein